MTNRSFPRIGSDAADAATAAYLRQNGCDETGRPFIFDLKNQTLVAACSRDALVAGSFPANRRSAVAAKGRLMADDGADDQPNDPLAYLADPAPPLDDCLTTGEVEKRSSNMQRDLRWYSYLADFLTAKGDAESRSERAERLLEQHESDMQRDILSATIYADLSKLGYKSDQIISRLCDAMDGCSSSSAYARVKSGNEHIRAGVVALGFELPSARKVAPRPKVDLKLATRRSEYNNREWHKAIEQLPASARYEFVDYLAAQISRQGLYSRKRAPDEGHLESEEPNTIFDSLIGQLGWDDNKAKRGDERGTKPATTKLKMIPQEIDDALEELGINTRALRRLIGGLSPQERDEWVANARVKILRAEFFGTARQRADIRERVPHEVFERHVKELLVREGRRSTRSAVTLPNVYTDKPRKKDAA